MSLYRDVYPCTYIFIKEMIITHTFLNQHKLLTQFLSTILACLIIILLLTTLSICLIKNFVIRLFLSLRYNKKFVEVLSMDSYFECTKNKISLVYVIEHSGSIEELQTIITESTNRLLQSHYKFSSTIHNVFGVYYYLKNNAFLNEIFSIEDINVPTKDCLSNYLEKNCFSDWDDQLLWKVIMFNSSIKWNEMDQSKTYYPILIRCNHCLGDGISLSLYIQKYFLNDVKSGCLEKVLKKTNFRCDFNRSNIGSVLFAGPKLNYSEVDSTNSPQRLATFIEEEPKYLYLIKYISKQLDCSFTDVITICTMLSITNYLKLDRVKTKNVIVFNTTRPVGDDINPSLEEKKLTNNFTLEAFNLPLKDDIKTLKNQSILNQSKEILPILKDGRYSATGQIIYLFTKFLPLLHPKLLMKFARYNSIGATLGITNIPFADYCKIGRNIVTDIFAFTNNFENTKFVLVMFTYQDRLETTLITKKDLKISRVELQVILDNSFLNINRLYEEVKLNEC